MPTSLPDKSRSENDIDKILKISYIYKVKINNKLTVKSVMLLNRAISFSTTGMEDKSTKYIEAVGRRKTSVARVRITPSTKTSYLVNEKEMAAYFPEKEMQNIVAQPLSEIKEKFKVTIKTKGGGIHSQAEAVRHGIARALVDHDLELRKNLKKAGYLKRDPRSKERRKFGLKKARKAPQWSKR